MSSGNYEDRIVRLREALKVVGLGRSAFYLAISRGEIPASVRLGRRAVGWRMSQLQEIVRRGVELKKP